MCEVYELVVAENDPSWYTGFLHSCNTIQKAYIHARAPDLRRKFVCSSVGCTIAVIIALPTSCEPLHSTAYSNDLHWKVVWQSSRSHSIKL